MSYAYIAVIVIAVVLAVSMAPKAPTTPPASLSDLDIPTAEEGRPIPVCFGVVTFTSPNVVWFGHLGYAAVKTKGGK